MKFKRHILMTSAAAALALGVVGTHAHAQAAAGTTASTDTSTTVVVTGIRKSLQSSLKQKRNSDVVEEVITAEDVGKFPDKNVADSLARASGVNVTTGSPTAGGFGENERISIRGTDPELNLTLLDGHNIATGDWFILDQTAGGRSFNYTMLPSEIVGTAEVIKSSKASDPEGGIGGSVDVHMRNPLDLPANTFAGSAQALYSTLADKTTPYLSASYSWRNANRNFGILLGAFYEQRDFRRDGQELIGYAGQANFANSGKTVYVPQLIGSEYFTQQRTRQGVDFNSQWKPSDTLEIDVSGLYTYMKADNINHNFMMWGSHLEKDIPNAGYTTTQAPDGNTYLTSATWTAAAVKANPNSTTPGVDDGAIVQDDIARKSHSDSSNINVDVNWQASEKLKVKGQLGWTSGDGVTDDTAAWETLWKGVGASFTLGKPTKITYSGLPSDPTSAAYLNNTYNWSWGGHQSSPDRELYGKFDVDYALDGLFKDVAAGARFTDHTRELNYYAYSWGGNGTLNPGQSLASVYGGTTPSNYGDGIGGVPGYSFGTADNIFNYEDSHSGGRKYAFYPPSSFSVHEKTQAYYVMTNLGDDKWHANVGVRAVHTDTQSLQYAASSTVDVITDQFGSWGQVKTTKSYWDILPSLNFTYKASDDVVLRAGAAKVMTRPGYAQLAGYFYLVDANYTGGAGGNPDLEPYRATQYNLSAEWYYAPEALLSVELFDLDISNYISTTSFSGFYTDQQNPAGHIFTLTGPANGGKAASKGVEVNWQQPLAYGFGVIANATYASPSTSTGQPLVGTSRLTYNLTGYYENGPISTRLSYNFRSHFYVGLANNSPDYQDDYGTLDGTFSYQINPNWTFTIDAQNLTHSKLYYYDQIKTLPRAYYDNGQEFYAGFHFKY